VTTFIFECRHFDLKRNPSAFIGGHLSAFIGVSEDFGIHEH